jgi:hypothetical protein
MTILKVSGHNDLIGTFDLYIQIAACLKLGVSRDCVWGFEHSQEILAGIEL